MTDATVETELQSTFELNNASSQFAKEIINLIGHEDISQIIDLQEEISDTLRLSCEALAQMNDFAGKEYSKLSKEYLKHTKMLKEMKSDLDYIFQKIRILKGKVQDYHPPAITQKS